MKKPHRPDVVARAVVDDYLDKTAVTIHDIVERDAAGFNRLLDSISGKERRANREREEKALDKAIRAALPDLAERISDARGGEIIEYLEAGYLIGLAVGRREGER